MASYHLSVKTIKRSAGRSATAAAAYRSGELILCDREGRVHDYTRKLGVEQTFILAPEHAPDWARDRAALWNAAEARETRSNSVTAREWELALPSEISADERARIARAFAAELVERYGVVADVAIHAPHREGDQRNHHAHVLTTTRELTADGFTDKTRVLDAAKTGSVEIGQMREVWAGLQNHALEHAEHATGLEAGALERVDHRSLAVQREVALERGDALSAEELDRAPEVKLGPAANALERRAMQEAWYEDRAYEPVTERGARVHAVRQARELFADMRVRLERARETYSLSREAGLDRVSAGLAALRSVAAKERSLEQEQEGTAGADSIRERLARILGREAPEKGLELGAELGRDRELGDGGVELSRSDSINDRLREVLGRDREVDEGGGTGNAGSGGKPSIRDRLQKPGKALEQEDGHEQEREPKRDKVQELKRDRDLDLDDGHEL